ncbi:MAG: hypothetical protein GYB67_02115 [Chloroflexi bacterium]|nr:hypothetical protein [Chloroflexota bacterium]
MLGPNSPIDRNLILTGYVGPDQFAIARRVAATLRLPLVPFEQRLEDHAGMPLEDIRVRYGEARIKLLETELLNEILLYRGAVLHIGGQTLMRSNHLERLAATGPVICVVATLDAVLQRLHLALGARYHDPNERALALGHLRREWSVRGQPGVHEIDTSYRDDAAIIHAIIACWREAAAVLDWRPV